MCSTRESAPEVRCSWSNGLSGLLAGAWDGETAIVVYPRCCLTSQRGVSSPPRGRTLTAALLAPAFSIDPASTPKDMVAELRLQPKSGGQRPSPQKGNRSMPVSGPGDMRHQLGDVGKWTKLNAACVEVKSTPTQYP